MQVGFRNLNNILSKSIKLLQLVGLIRAPSDALNVGRYASPEHPLHSSYGDGPYKWISPPLTTVDCANQPDEFLKNETTFSQGFPYKAPGTFP